jgi:hypothetical protein
VPSAATAPPSTALTAIAVMAPSPSFAIGAGLRGSPKVQTLPSAFNAALGRRSPAGRGPAGAPHGTPVPKRLSDKHLHATAAGAGTLSRCSQEPQHCKSNRSHTARRGRRTGIVKPYSREGRRLEPHAWGPLRLSPVLTSGTCPLGRSSKNARYGFGQGVRHATPPKQLGDAVGAQMAPGPYLTAQSASVAQLKLWPRTPPLTNNSHGRPCQSYKNSPEDRIRMAGAVDHKTIHAGRDAAALWFARLTRAAAPATLARAGAGIHDLRRCTRDRAGAGARRRVQLLGARAVRNAGTLTARRPGRALGALAIAR